MNHSVKMGLVLGTAIGIFGYLFDPLADTGIAIIGGIVWGLIVAGLDAAIGKWWADAPDTDPAPLNTENGE